MYAAFASLALVAASTAPNTELVVVLGTNSGVPSSGVQGRVLLFLSKNNDSVSPLSLDQLAHREHAATKMQPRSR